MRWKGRERSRNIEDRRGSGGGGKVIGGGIGVLVIAVIVYLLGGDPTQVLQQAGELQQTTNENYTPPAEENEAEEFVAIVLKETERFWHQQFSEMGKEYPEPVLVLFRSQVTTDCGGATSASGPFYCPADQKIYIDLSFYDELHSRFGAPGDFAMAYVVAHEVGHHVQTVLGISDKVRVLKERGSEKEANRLSVMQELQADFFAGLWAHYADRMHNLLEEGDIEEALNTASAIGDDKLQKQAQGYVVPDAFTHGTSAQRMKWFYKGYTTGDISQGDTYGAEDL
ncbi:MAG: zinc metallopeptidase [Taibaiella sp.]|nr:zinc metallopeptidase [Taibaiella sp.]